MTEDRAKLSSLKKPPKFKEGGSGERGGEGEGAVRGVLRAGPDSEKLTLMKALKRLSLVRRSL